VSITPREVLQRGLTARRYALDCHGVFGRTSSTALDCGHGAAVLVRVLVSRTQRHYYYVR
jgi:hypothetical protein